ncbi:MAG: hypothetical protein Q7N50_13805 [Armatimonadota bacterium]|nr:hypothetical protein [Armatimonadota bacterium]
MKMELNAKDELIRLTHKLIQQRRLEFLVDTRWHDELPKAGGVYAIWEKQTREAVAVYVGETCCLEHRFADLDHTRNHPFLGKAAEYLELSRGDEHLKPQISQSYCISYLELDFGRKELEEYLVLRWKPKFNKTPGRLKFNTHYGWLTDNNHCASNDQQ